MFVELLIVAIFGAIFGSFLNVLILRLREEMSMMGRSHCPHCHTTLRARHLVPILSWLFLRGRCAFCHGSIHPQYPLVELASAFIWVFAYVQHPFLLQLSAWPIFLAKTLFLMTLLALVVFDLRWKLLPIEPIIVMTVLAVLWNVLSGSLSLFNVVFGMVIGGAFLGVQVWLSKGRAMGAGDPWLGLLMGAWLGWPRVGVALYLTYILGGLIILPLFLTGVVRKGSRIPFAPLLALGTLGSMVFGHVIEGWVQTLFR